jgi:hypothetical protein
MFQYRNEPCPKCTAPSGMHSLHCQTLQLPPGWYERLLEEEEAE